MTEEKIMTFLKQAVEKGRFGPNVQIIDVRFDDTKSQDQYASYTLFVSVNLKQRDVVESIELVIKLQPQHDLVRQFVKTNIQFYNEALMYEDILPYLNVGSTVQEIFPKNFFSRGNYSNVDEDVIMIENLTKLKFRLTEEKCNLDIDHAFLAVKELGRFHALSYIKKQNNYDEFMNNVNKLQEVKYAEGQKEEIHLFCRQAMMRGLKPYLKDQKYKHQVESFISKMNDPMKFMRHLILPEEPTAVLCHGDFCRNNMLFKYDGGKPTAVKFFDLATARYCSPAIDLSFFFFLNLNSEIRNTYWDDLLKAYHDSVTHAISGVVVPTFEDIKLEMRKKAVYGYLISCLFLPAMSDGINMDDFEEILARPKEEIGEMIASFGGEEMTQVVGDMVKDLLEKKCL